MFYHSNLKDVVIATLQMGKRVFVLKCQGSSTQQDLGGRDRNGGTFLRDNFVTTTIRAVVFTLKRQARLAKNVSEMKEFDKSCILM